MKVEEMQNSEVKDYLLEHLEIGVLFSKLTEKADELSKAATIRAEIMGFNPTPAEVLIAEGILRKNMAEVILICEILACNTDAWDNVKDIQEEIARKWVELMMKDKEVGVKDTPKKKADVAPVIDWIPCSERLPDKSDFYMVCAYNGDTYDYRKNWFYHEDDYGDSEWTGLIPCEKVIAWVPLPEPYRENKGDERC